jgi:hypothetical protein
LFFETTFLHEKTVKKSKTRLQKVEKLFTFFIASENSEFFSLFFDQLEATWHFPAEYSSLREKIERETNLIVVRATRNWGSRFNFVADHVNFGKRA